MLVPGYNKAVQIGRTVINFSVKPLTHGRNNFGPRPNETLITGKLKQEEQKEMGSLKQKSPIDRDGECEDDDAGILDSANNYGSY